MGQLAIWPRLRRQPWWLALAILLQAGTYLAQGDVWRMVARAARLSLPAWLPFKHSLANLFANQVLPSGGVSGVLVVTRGLEHSGIPRPVSMASVVVDGAAYYAAYVAALAAALCIAVVDGEAPPRAGSCAFRSCAVCSRVSAKQAGPSPEMCPCSSRPVPACPAGGAPEDDGEEYAKCLE